MLKRIFLVGMAGIAIFAMCQNAGAQDLAGHRPQNHVSAKSAEPSSPGRGGAKTKTDAALSRQELLGILLLASLQASPPRYMH